MTYKKVIFCLIVLHIITISVGCTSKNMQSSNKTTVAVSILPQKAFVEAVAGDLIDVITLIPAGASPTNYQPSPKEMSAFQDAKIYFTIGVLAEESNILPNIASNNKDIITVHLEDTVDLKYEPRYFKSDHEHVGRDPHIWMSPKRVIVMIEEIRDNLIAIDPENIDTYTNNAKAYIKSLQEIDVSLTDTISKLENLTFIIMHPSLGYFADDYGLEMIALEEDGKEMTASHLEEIIDFAKNNNIKAIFYQSEFDNTQAKTLATEIDGETLAIEPLSQDYIKNLEKIAQLFLATLN